MSLAWARALARGLRAPRGLPQVVAAPRRQASEVAPGRPAGDGDAGDDDGDAEGGAGPAAFGAALAALERAPGRRRGPLELVPAALAAMAACGVAGRRDAYHRLLRLFPRGPLLPRGPLQRLLSPCPRHQACALQLLEQMEAHGVVPDAETQFLLLGVFGPRSPPVRKCQRMLYWLPRFRHADPHPLPPRLPPEPLERARLALRRIVADPRAPLTVYQMPVPTTLSSGEETVLPYIIGAQSAEQREQLGRHDPARPVVVEGPFPLWLRGTRLAYYVLRGQPPPPGAREEPPDPERSFYFPLQLDLDLERGPWDDDDFDVDEVEEGPVFGLCMAGAGDRATLARWLAGLQLRNPVLARTPVVFRLGGAAAEPPPPAAAGTPLPAAAGPPPAALPRAAAEEEEEEEEEEEPPGRRVQREA
ncbi:evolutionarily conserved signaling intermediate in Toll pathway, mitochondrial [Dromaius novaehollandiae]|uniref:evolutionarily conserved signaling intermediate in Toll pathway, mitochondrial n=1 Tax=Dromaius novaehollandiae TaxID=8790 RepID=UPI0031201C48